MNVLVYLLVRRAKKKRVKNRKSDLIMFTVTLMADNQFESERRQNIDQNMSVEKNVWIELRSNLKTVNCIDSNGFLHTCFVSLRCHVGISYSTISKSRLLCDTIAIAYCCIIQLYEKQCLIFDGGCCFEVDSIHKHTLNFRLFFAMHNWNDRTIQVKKFCILNFAKSNDSRTNTGTSFSNSFRKFHRLMFWNWEWDID